MKRINFVGRALPFRVAPVIATLLAVFLGTGQLFFFTAQAEASGAKLKEKEPANDLRIAQVLTRLTFGIRPGDVERVKAMGINAFIMQQLDPDSIKDTGLDERLRKLPTLVLATPALIEQYTPPKPDPSPSPKPPSVATPPLPFTTSPVADQKGVAMPPPQTAGSVEQSMRMEKTGPEISTAARQPSAGEMKAPAVDIAKEGQSSPVKPAPPKPPKNPQMVVTELQRAALLRGVYSERQLYEVMVNFWENHFSIFANKDADRFMLTEFDRDAIRPFALESFRDLLRATAHSSAMLYYLDNWQSGVQRNYPAANGKPARTLGGLNENYARELMELHTLGVDGGYTQKDVQEVARCFTGWTIRKPNEVGLFFFNPATHDYGEKIVLGHKISAGGGISDGEKVLDILAGHPSTAHFIATKLARRFVSDDPPPSVIKRAAATFLKTEGSIRETLRAIITSPEFFSANAYRAKVRTPFEYATAAMRALDAETDADPAVLGWIARMGQPVFGRLTPEGYPDRAEQWLATGPMLERLNFAIALAANKLKGAHIDPVRLFAGVDLHNPAAVTPRLSQLILAGDMSEQTRRAIDKIANQESAGAAMSAAGVIPTVNSINYTKETGVHETNSAATAFVTKLITMVIGSPEFQRR